MSNTPEAGAGLRPHVRALRTSTDDITCASPVEHQPVPVVRFAGSPLHAALDYCARQLLAELRLRTPDSPTRLRHRLTPTSLELLRWWFADDIRAARVDNFHIGQREAILHTILAHEILQSDDPELLYRLACQPQHIDAQPRPTGARHPRTAAYTLRMAPGSGQTWVASALLIWQWANQSAAEAAGLDDPRFSRQMVLLAADTTFREHADSALFGPVVAGCRRDPTQGSVMRHARLFLPPLLRARFLAWLLSQLRDQSHRTLVMLAPSDGTAPAAPLTLVVGTGASILAGHDTASPTTPSTSASLLWLAFEHTNTTSGRANRPAALAVFDVPRAIRHGAAKLPVLEATALQPRSRLRACPSRQGLRPRLRRHHAALLRQGLAGLRSREAIFAKLDPQRSPRMLVFCDSCPTQRAARAFLLSQGVDASDITLIASRERASDHRPPSSRIVFDDLSAPRAIADPRICVIVILRTHMHTHTGLDVLRAGLPMLWPEPDFEAVRVDNCERMLAGRAPGHCIDTLSILDHPQCHTALRAACGGMVARTAHADDATTAGALIVAGLRDDAADYDLLLPPTCADLSAFEAPECLSSVPMRILHAPLAMPVRKSIYPLAGWQAHDNGLRRAFIETAEADDRIESHCLLDPRRHASRSRDVLLSLGFDGRGLIDCVVRTATHVFLVELLPFSPARAQATNQSERALRRWCRHTNALPPAQRSARLWRRVRVHAPLFWTCKRSGVALSALLSALAETRVLAHPGRPADSAQ